MKKIILVTLLAGGFATQSQAINYNYLDLGYDFLDTDRSNADGVSLEGSFSINEQFYLGGFYKDLSGRYIDFSRYAIFGGYHTELSSQTDFFTQLELGQLDTRFGHKLAYGLAVGTRSEITEQFELNTKLGYTHVKNLSDGYYEIELQGLYKFNETVGMTADLKTFDGDFGVGLGVRFDF